MKPLLVVIDMQRDFITGTLGTPEAQAIVPAVCQRIQTFPGDIVYTRDTHDENYLSIVLGEENETYTAGKTAAILDKPTFASTALVDFAAAGGYDAIELVGVCTDICVISNALCLKSRLWEVPISVRASCCAGSTPEHHANALSVMESCQIDLLYEEQH